MKKKIRNFLLLGVTLGLVTSAAITIPLVMTHNTTITTNNVVSGTTSEVTSPSTTTPQVTDSNSKLITTALAQKETSDSTSKPDMNGYDEVSRITKTFESGTSKYKVFKHNYSHEDVNYDKVGDDAYEEKDLYQGSDYYNQRDIMPILSTSYNYSYPNERSQNDVEYDAYHGWNKLNTTYYDSEVNNDAYKQTTYTASNVLKETLDDSVKNKISSMKSLAIDFTKINSEKSVDEINSKINTFVNNGCNFIIINNANQKQLEKIIIPNGVKKLTIKDFDGKLESLRGISISNSVEELEFYSTTATKVDPLVLPSTTHFIYDHISGDNITSGKLTFNPFTMIDLSLHKNLTTHDLQKAINTIYGERQYERNFQGNFSGGYIYQLDLSNTGITSLNNVYVPTQSDGRFNIAYVKWTSGASGGSATITIGGTQINPGNDGNVNEWYDGTGKAEKVKKLELRTEENKTITSEAVKTELNGLLKKYPNVTIIDITNVKLSKSENKEELAKELYDILKNTYTSKGLEVPQGLKIIYGTNQEINSNSKIK